VRITGYCGQYKLAGAAASLSVVRDLILRRKEKGGASVHMSETQINREDDSLMVFQIVRVPCAISSMWASGGHVSPLVGRLGLV
jgi:hypothetical protein